MSSNSDSDPATEPPGADVGRRYGLHPTRWYLVETLTDSPTVIAEDDTARRCRPLKNMFRGPALPAVSAVVSEVRATRKSAHAPIPRVFGDLESLIGIPVFGPSGEVFAVQVTCRDKSHAQRPPTPVVAGWEFEIRSPEHPLRTQWTSQFRQLYGIADSADKDLSKESMGLADLYKRVPRPSDVARLMTGVIDARDGHLDDGTLVIRRDDDALRLVCYVRRAISDKGSTWLRGIDHDITSTTSTGDLAIATLDAEIASTIARTTGTHCALIDARTGLVISWVSEPVEGLDDDTIGGRTPLLDRETCLALRSNFPTVTSLTNHQTMLVRSFPCIGHGATAAALLLLSAVPY